ncbi:hypothetical protein BRDID11004_08620 [Bradyrhizobium diazoefficiens]|uniref:RepB-like DNA primase domain-containing protein n=1 Tax=Bradyrhizobium diazoefficiens TaxID=1355477 RepID=A0A810A5U1_9BRAD|nr:DUF3987 domain-containing protein [Bradyrhizobium diazoefficiens]BBZ98229.1 hypothetical protein F07S3_80620 [Bradyrhizobium diazoefficiens]BCA15914.1 hypothetical protein BDHF08_77610 [Bradyrhizobium diazoefficiens]BCE60326.1 hypothetical protein XF5B_78380 [Bradyrhizobium diazoefficiens]BCE69010.1 hypothetical protein XF6B_78090 [Bradyrhizobium diazoefficiens]
MSTSRNSKPANTIETRTDTAVSILWALDSVGRHDLAAIDPTLPVGHPAKIETATFQPSQRADAGAWIEARQGRKNLYTSVNRAAATAPTARRLNRENIGTIRAVVADLDPRKLQGGDASGENFKRERSRLLEVVTDISGADCPPTLIVDSGGGYQAWWQLAKPLPATPENVELVEGIGRTIQQRYGGDSVFDIARIMRLPGTVNVPGPEKAAQGRAPALASVLPLSTGLPATLEALRAWAPPTAAASAKPDAKLPEIELPEVAHYDELPSALRQKFEAARERDPVLDKLWAGTPAPEQVGTSPSEFEFALAGRLKRAGGFTPNEFAALLWVWEFRTEKELDERRIARSWANNQTVAADDAAGLERHEIAERQSGGAADAPAAEWGEPADVWMDETNPPDLPPGVVPAIIEAAARDDARRLGIEPGASAAARIVALGSLVPAGNQMQMRQHDTGWTVRPVLWMGLFGPPGSNKSATLKYAMAPVNEIESDAAKRYAKEKRAHDAKQAQLAKSAPATGQADGRAETIAPDFEETTREPIFRRKLVEDATTEKLVALLDQNPDGLLYFGDELAGLFGGMDAYRAKGGKDRPIWLKFKDGAAVTVDRMGRDSIHVPVGAVSVLGGMQPAKIKALSAGLTDDGMLQRLLPVIIKKLPDDEDPDIAPDGDVADAVHRVARSLVDSGAGKRFRFTIEGDQERRQLESFVKREMALPKASASFAQWLEKLPNEFGRLALVFHFVEWYARPEAALGIDPEPAELVSGDTARRARRFLEEFAHPHAAVFYNHVLGASQIEEHARWVAGFIVARGLASITERDVYKNYSAFKGQDTRGDLTNTMRDLELNDWLRPTKFAGGRPTHWAVNPAAHVAFAERAQSERERRSRAMDAIAQAAALRRVGDKSPGAHPQ